jgi:hypothetical protein
MITTLEMRTTLEQPTNQNVSTFTWFAPHFLNGISISIYLYAPGFHITPGRFESFHQGGVLRGSVHSLRILRVDNRISLAVLQTLTFSAVGENPTKRSTHKTVLPKG